MVLTTLCLCVCDRYWKTFVVDPSQSYYYRWLFVISFAVLYNIVIVIARSVFAELQTEYLALWMVLDYFSDFLYIMDMLISMRTGTADTSEAYLILFWIHICISLNKAKGLKPISCNLQVLLKIKNTLYLLLQPMKFKWNSRLLLTKLSIFFTILIELINI